MMHRRLLCAAALLGAVVQPYAAPYTFTALGAPSPGFMAPALNNAGTIALGAGEFPSQRFELWPRGGGASPLLDTSGIFASFTRPTPYPLNSSGTIAFRGTLDTGVEGIYTYGPAGLKTIADTTGPYSGFRSGPTLPTLNDQGWVSFTAELKGGGTGVFMGDGSTTATLATTAGGTFSSFSQLGISSNNRNDTAVVSTLTAGGQALLLSSGGAAATPIVDTSGPISSFASLFHMNDSGVIPFVANMDAGGQSIFLWDKGTLTPIFSTSGPITGLFNASINNHGTVAFMTNESGVRYSLYLYTPETGAQRLIGAGDDLFGSTVALTGLPDRGVFTAVNSLNDADELAFAALLADGRSLVVLASPIPELSTFSLLLLGLAATGLIQVRRRGRAKPALDQATLRPSKSHFIWPAG